MRVNTYNVKPVYDEVIRVAKAERFTGRIFRDNVSYEVGLWFEVQPDQFVLGASPWDALEWKASHPDVKGYVSLALLRDAYPEGEIIPTP